MTPSVKVTASRAAGDPKLFSKAQCAKSCTTGLSSSGACSHAVRVKSANPAARPRSEGIRGGRRRPTKRLEGRARGGLS